MAEAKQVTKNIGALSNIGANKPAELRSYDPPNADKIAYFFADAFGDGGRDSVRQAKKFTELAQVISDYGTLPFYFTKFAPLAAAFDTARGVVYDDPYEVALGALGIARPLKSMAPTMSDASERALSYAFGAGGTGIAAQDAAESFGVLDLIKSIFTKAENEN
tara:strand:+ start:136 stop:624 length:489 start_codon:yes stop_codon:yes gene_type:complete